jgi:hypothetical protein
LRSAIALVTGVACSVAQPAASNPAVATEAWMKARLVSFIQESPWPQLVSTRHAEDRAKSMLDQRDWRNYLLRCNTTY